MKRCLNCSFLLVLLERRRRYKCAKCGRLFSEKEVNNKDFREFDVSEKKKDIVRFERYLKLRRNLLRLSKVDPIERELRLKISKLKYYVKNRAKILARSKEYYRTHKENHNVWKRKYRNKDIETTRHFWRVYYYRQEQKKLALKVLEYGEKLI